MNKTEAQIIVVGSGMNSLVCAALLAKRGKSVLVLERNDRAGGCIRTEELFPGFQHEVLSSWYPLFMGGAAYPELKDDLAGLGAQVRTLGKPFSIDDLEALLDGIQAEVQDAGVA